MEMGDLIFLQKPQDASTFEQLHLGYRLLGTLF